MNDMLLILLSGGLGSVCRYSLTLAAGRVFGHSFAWGTMAANLLGCLAIGFAAGLVDRSLVSRTIRILAITGFLGGFTTFSTFSVESLRMLLDGAVVKGLLNIGVNVAGGLLFTGIGLHAASRL